MMSLRCRKCETTKLLSEFYPHHQHPNKGTGECKKCFMVRNYAYKTKAINDNVGRYFSVLVTTARNNAKKRKLEWRLSTAALLALFKGQLGLCALTGTPMTHIRGQGRIPTNISIDRIDSSCGYVPDNVQLVCNIVNHMKMEFGLSDLLTWCRRVMEHQYV